MNTMDNKEEGEPNRGNNNDRKTDNSYTREYQEINEIPASHRSLFKRKRPRPIKLLNTNNELTFKDTDDDGDEDDCGTTLEIFDSIGVNYRPFPLLSSLATISRKRCGGDLDIPLMSFYKNSFTSNNNDSNSNNIDDTNKNEENRNLNGPNKNELMNGVNEEMHTNDNNLDDNTIKKNSSTTNNNDNYKDNKNTSKVIQDYNELLQNNNLSTLEQKNHGRYLSLKEQTNQPSFILLNNRSHMILKEYSKLKDSINNERDLYKMQIWKFLQRQVSRFLIGFTSVSSGQASHFVYSKSKYILQWKNRWMSNNDNYYGKCVQQISLPISSSASNSKTNIDDDRNNIPIILPNNLDNDKSDSIMKGNNVLEGIMNYLSPEILENDNNIQQEQQQPILIEDEKIIIDKLMKLPSLVDFSSSLYNNAKKKSKKIPSLLSSDNYAIHLAKTHNAYVIMNDITYITLLQQLPVNETNKRIHQWKIPVHIHTYDYFHANKGTISKKKKLFILEDPIPKLSTPRECLEEGFNEAITNALLDDNELNNNIHYTYALITLPPPSFSHVRLSSSYQTCKVLIRSAVDVNVTNCTNTSDATNDDDHNDHNLDHQSLLEMLANASATSNNLSNNNISTLSLSPMKRFISLEYFSELQLKEHLTLEEKIPFFIHKILLKKSSLLYLFHINVTNASIMQIDEVKCSNNDSSVDDDDTAIDDNTTMDLSQEEWKQFQNRLEIISTFIHSFISSLFITTNNKTSSSDIKNHKDKSVNNNVTLQSFLFCLPAIMGSASSSSFSTVSVHGALPSSSSSSHNNNNDAVKIDIFQELVNAESVSLDSNTLLSCFRIWEWEENKHPSGMIPFTLPWKKTNKRNNDEHQNTMWRPNMP